MSPLVIAAGGIAVFGVVVALAYRLGWQWTGLPAAPDTGSERSAKTLWDWLQLLGIPLALAVLAFLLNAAQSTRDQHSEDLRAKNQAVSAKEAAREETLRTYLAQMSDLMLKHKLLEALDRYADSESRPDAPVRQVARTATRTAVRRLDGERAAVVIRFLSESHLLRGLEVPFGGLDLHGQDFSYQDLHGLTLSGANLSGANFLRANLSGAVLMRADLNGATLEYADLREAFLNGANLREASLRFADLSKAILPQADLRSADLLDADLSGANLGRTDLTDADLNGTNIEAADLRGARGIGVDRSGSVGQPAHGP